MGTLFINVESAIKKMDWKFFGNTVINITQVNESQTVNLYVVKKTVIFATLPLNSFKHKTQLIDQQEHLERYCNVQLVFGFNSSKCGSNLIKSYLLPLFIN